MSASLRLAAVAGLALSSAPAVAYDYTFTDPHGTFYGLTIGADIGGQVSTDEFLVTLFVDTTGNDDLTRFLDAASIKLAPSVALSSLTLLTGPGTWANAPGGTNSGGCDGSGSGFMCASGHELLSSGPYTFQWDMTIAAGTLFTSGSDISLKAVYNAGQGGNNGFYQVSTPMDPVPGIAEPGTYAMLLAGLGVVGFMARRKRRD
jgi:hypothetical protein